MSDADWVWTLDSTPAIINVGSLVLCLRGLGSLLLLPLLLLRVHWDHPQTEPPPSPLQFRTLEDLAIPQIRWFCIFLPRRVQTTKFSLASLSAETMPLPLPFRGRGVIVQQQQPRVYFASFSRANYFLGRCIGVVYESDDMNINEHQIWVAQSLSIL